MRKKIHVNTNEPVFFPYSITINKGKGSCITINELMKQGI